MDNLDVEMNEHPIVIKFNEENRPTVYIGNSVQIKKQKPKELPQLPWPIALIVAVAMVVVFVLLIGHFTNDYGPWEKFSGFCKVIWDSINNSTKSVM